MNIVCYQNWYQSFTTTWTRHECSTETGFIDSLYIALGLKLHHAGKELSKQTWSFELKTGNKMLVWKSQFLTRKWYLISQVSKLKSENCHFLVYFNRPNIKLLSNIWVLRSTRFKDVLKKCTFSLKVPLSFSITRTLQVLMKQLLLHITNHKL